MHENVNPVQTRQATIDDISIIKDFYSEAFPEVSELKYPSRWNWLYVDNPFCASDKGLPVWISADKDKVYGMAGTIQSPFQINGTVFNAAWGCDLRVSSEARGQGLGKALEKARMADDFFSLQMSKLSRVVKLKAGGVPGRTTTAYLHVKQFEPCLLFKDLLRYLRFKSDKTSLLYRISVTLYAHKLFSFFITSLFNLLPKMKAASSGRTNLSNLEFKAVDSFDETATKLWDIVSKRYSFAVRRDSEYLNWKFVKQPHIKYQRFLVLDDGALCGVLIFRLGQKPEVPIGTIAEVYTSRGESHLREIIAFAVRSLYEQGALMIRCASSTEELSKILSKMGFRALQYYVPLFRLKNSLLQNKALSGRWLLSFGDQDLDEYPHAGQPSLKEVIQVFLGKLIGHEDMPV